MTNYRIYRFFFIMVQSSSSRFAIHLHCTSLYKELSDISMFLSWYNRLHDSLYIYSKLLFIRNYRIYRTFFIMVQSSSSRFAIHLHWASLYKELSDTSNFLCFAIHLVRASVITDYRIYRIFFMFRPFFLLTVRYKFTVSFGYDNLSDITFYYVPVFFLTVRYTHTASHSLNTNWRIYRTFSCFLTVRYTFTLSFGFREHILKASCCSV